MKLSDPSNISLLSESKSLHNGLSEVLCLLLLLTHSLNLAPANPVILSISGSIFCLFCKIVLLGVSESFVKAFYGFFTDIKLSRDFVIPFSICFQSTQRSGSILNGSTIRHTISISLSGKTPSFVFMPSKTLIISLAISRAFFLSPASIRTFSL